MNEEEQAIEDKMRGLAGNMTRPEGLVMLNLLLERSSVDEIANAIKLALLSRDVNQLSHQISNF